eukprot:SAG22_NODE_8323_length_664_cov_1.253097_2_plen_28_part_01
MIIAFKREDRCRTFGLGLLDAAFPAPPP